MGSLANGSGVNPVFRRGLHAPNYCTAVLLIMLKIESIELTNFRSFAGEHFFEFPKVHGLYCVTGENKDNPRLGRNGVGKSSLLEAVFWSIYGKTTRSLKGGDVVTWGAKGCSVTTTIVINDKTYSIERRQNPNSLTLDGKPVDQEAINKAIRLGPEAFCYAVILPQFGSSFFDLTPANKLTLFSEIMELDYWLEKSKTASLAADQLIDTRAAKERKLAKCQGQLEAAKSDIKQLELEEASFNKNKAAEISGLKNKLQSVSKNLQNEEIQLASAKAAVLLAEKNLAKLPIPKVTAGFSADVLRATLAKMKGLGAQCPTCLQTVPSSHLKAETARLKAELVRTEAEVKKATELAQDRLIVTQNRDDFTRECRKIENTIFSLKKDIETLNDKIKAEDKARNPYGFMLTQKRQGIEHLKAAAIKIQGEIDVINKDYEAVNFWNSGFKRVRLFLIEETIKQLEIEVNNNLANLGLTDWHVEFDVERENKSGGVTKGFTVLVYAPGHEQAVRYEAWSGGETQRLRLAGDLGLANLIMERAGLSSSFEAYDEPSEHMSQEGLNDLVETLAERAENTKKVILIVDHHSIEYGGFAGVITIIKDKNGSRIS